VLKHFLNNDSGKAILFAGVFLLIAAAATMLIKTRKLKGEDMVLTGGGH
jgi:maltose/moltooligosaccharide transporter